MLKIAVKIIVLFVTVVVVYSSVNLITFGRIIFPFPRVTDDEIIKIAVNRGDIQDRVFIICQWTRTTEFNFVLIQDEDGNRVNSHCIVTGIDLEKELSYDFLISGNYFVFYVVEKTQHFDPRFSEDGFAEYVVDGWDVLSPVRRNALFNRTPRYVLIEDLMQVEG